MSSGKYLIPAIVTDSNSGITKEEAEKMGIFLIPMPVIIDGKVCVVDNHRISVTMRESVLDAVFMTSEGKSAKEIKESLEKAVYDASIYIAVDTLEYLKKGGRITAAAAAFGSVSFSISTHVGPGAIGAGICVKNRED